MAQEFYQAEALIQVHDKCFGYIARDAGYHLLKLLQENKLTQGTVIDLGCGSGILSELIAEHGYNAVGVDYSAEFVEVAKKKVPQAQFVVQSLYDYEFPSCAAVACIGEVLNYYFEEPPGLTNLKLLFPKIYQALEPGGVLLFDIQQEGKRLVPENPKNHIREDENWVVFTEREEDLEKATFIKKFTTFKKVNDLYEKSKEVHRSQLYNIDAVIKLLTAIGFEVCIADGYNGGELHSRHCVFVAKKS